MIRYRGEQMGVEWPHGLGGQLCRIEVWVPLSPLVSPLYDFSRYGFHNTQLRSTPFSTRARSTGVSMGGLLNQIVMALFKVFIFIKVYLLYSLIKLQTLQPIICIEVIDIIQMCTLMWNLIIGFLLGSLQSEGSYLLFKFSCDFITN